ncbi:unnamed protein product [Hyaloperonospora brassicae]|uniref:FCP1 homology domain-containing protein n=1 Tax=Hyaloperonospora brassicae TaxID=162125 RepID=A0AAV0UAS4_HYABA|nr:unnamed protein product [Hyaloperonospora brassicae]
MTRKQVAIGGTFACDEALAVPLQCLLQNAVEGADVDLQWLRYGSLANFDEWSSHVLRSTPPVNVVLLLVRLSDLAADHPELHVVHERRDGARYVAAESCVADGPICHFLSDLERYDGIGATAATPRLVVILCPCPPNIAAQCNAMERTVQMRAEAMQNVTVQSVEWLMTLFHQQYVTAFYDAVADKLQHSPYTQAMLNVLSLSLCRQICRLYRSASHQKKVIVLDCDNTLWGGAVAEVGASGIVLAPRFLALQRFIVAQQERGMLIALCSKNIPADVRDAFTQRRDDMILDMDQHVIAAKVNWQPKSENIAQLAHELSLGLDSFIFIDDNPLECHEVAAALPSVTVIPLGANFPEKVLDGEWVFDEGLGASAYKLGASILTKEDSQRTQLYQQNLKRDQLCKSSSTHRAFLSALGVKIVFEDLGQESELQGRSASFSRVLQLHHRTNQFCTATTFAKRLEEKELLDYIALTNHTVVCAHVTDRFGHYGLVSVALCHHARDSDVLHVDSFLLSCRALNRGVEHAMMRKLSEIAARRGCASLEFSWEPTERNKPAHAFFSALADVRFADTSGQLCQTSRSCCSTGTWVIARDKASGVSFLKSEVSSRHGSMTANGVTDGSPRVRLVQWLQDLGLLVLGWILSSIPMPRSLAHLFGLPYVRRLDYVRPVGALRVPLRDRGSLEQFLHPVLHDIATVHSFVGFDGGSVDTNPDKFRRKARHQTKLVLAKHTPEEAPRVIWSATQPHAAASDDPSIDDVAGSTVSLQLICKSPQCSTIVQRDSRCAFQRCRNCCYRIQRLVARSMHHKNARARDSAVGALQTELVDDVSLAPTTTSCKAHQNKRRRGTITRRIESK